MKTGYAYGGNELELFARATNWKRYVSGVIQPFIRGDVAEAGAGTGNFTPFLQPAAVKTWTYIEPDASFRHVIRKKIGDKLLPPGMLYHKLDEVPAGICFNTIIYLDVLEHIEHDKAEILTMIEHLAPGGHIILLTPAFSFLYSLFDKEIGHFRRYNRRQLKYLFDQRSSIVLSKYLDSAGFFVSLANRMMLKQPYPTLRQITIWDALLIPVSKIADKLFFHSFGRSVILVWKK